MTQGKIEFGAFIAGDDRKLLLSALKVTEEDLMQNCPIQIVSTGHSKVMIGMRNGMAVDALQPDFGALAGLSERIGCNGYFVFALNPGEGDILVKGRMFAPAIGINEDPVTGNANGPLGAYLVHHRITGHNGKLFKFKARQGEAIGRAGTVKVEVRIEGEEPVDVKISGKAAVVFQTELTI